MKKFILVAVVAGMTALVSCGDGGAAVEAARVADSIRVADSTAAAAAAVAEATRVADSVTAAAAAAAEAARVADSVAAAPKKGKGK